MPLQDLPYPGDCSACPHRSHKGGHFTIQCIPYLRACSFSVGLRVCRVRELIRHKVAGVVLEQSLGLHNSPLHPFDSRCQYYLCAKRGEKPESLCAHTLRHDQDGLIPLYRRYQRQANPCIPTRRLNNCISRTQPPCLFSRFYHAEAYPVLDTPPWIAGLYLRINVSTCFL